MSRPPVPLPLDAEGGHGIARRPYVAPSRAAHTALHWHCSSTSDCSTESCRDLANNGSDEDLPACMKTTAPVVVDTSAVVVVGAGVVVVGAGVVVVGFGVVVVGAGVVVVGFGVVVVGAGVVVVGFGV